jgi:acetyltransferase-like isoleucine patch superfamily enzyme
VSSKLWAAAHRLITRGSVWSGYTRGFAWRLMGARIGPKVAVGPQCRVDRAWGVAIGARSTLEPRVWLKLVEDEARLDIGEYTFLGIGTELDIADHIVIGNHVLIAPGCFITDHSHGLARELRIDQQPSKPMPVRIGDDVWIGTKSCILRGVTIGDGAVVGAGSIVRQDVAPYTIVAGAPARPIGERANSPAISGNSPPKRAFGAVAKRAAP